MNTQPEALRLADWHKAMAKEPKRNEAKRQKHLATEAELRRLYVHLSNLKKGHTLLVEENFNLKDQSQELLEALKHLAHNASVSGAEMGLALDVARAAIAKAEAK